MKSKKPKRRGAPKGNKYAAKPQDATRVTLGPQRIARATKERIERLRPRHGSVSRVIDAAVELLDNTPR